MKRLTSIAVLLTIAAALATTVISCTSDDNLTEQSAEPAVEQSATAETRTVHVTVGAGFADGSGDLTVYVWTYDEEKEEYVYRESSHTFTTADPLSECETANGILVHKNAVGFYVDEDYIYGEYTPTTASTVDELMTQSLPVTTTASAAARTTLSTAQQPASR